MVENYYCRAKVMEKFLFHFLTVPCVVCVPFAYLTTLQPFCYHSDVVGKLIYSTSGSINNPEPGRQPGECGHTHL